MTMTPKTLRNGTHTRGRGRPKQRPSGNAFRAGSLARESIIERAIELTKREPLSAISMVRLAKSLNVRPGTIHYHLGSRDDLISGVMNRFYRDLLLDLDATAPAATWQEEIRRIGWVWLTAKLLYPGVANYIASNDRFRVFQKTKSGEEDYGARYMDRVFGLLRNAGFTADIAAECWHLMALYANATAETIAMGHAPAAHSKFLLRRMERYDPASFPGLAFGLRALAELDARGAFGRSLDDLILGLEKRRHVVSGRAANAPKRMASRAKDVTSSDARAVRSAP
jgi:AcrR family transcriptional regulator